MVKIITALIILAIAIVIFIATKKSNQDTTIFKYSKKFLRLGSIFLMAVAVVTFLSGCFYTQNIGEVTIVKNWDGRVVSSTSEAGLHFKAPYQSVISYNTRNMLINFYSNASYHYDGGNATGPYVSINDKSGVQANVDVQIVYSLDPDYAISLYENYGTQTNYTQYYLSQDLRSVPRAVAGKFDTLTMLTDRSSFAEAVEKALEEKWKDNGIRIEQVSVQAVHYPDEITSKYAEAQSAEIAKAQALNEQEVTKIKAETLLIEAQAEADANKIREVSLSEQVLRQNYIDALKEMAAKGNLIIVPDGISPLINVDTNSSNSKD